MSRIDKGYGGLFGTVIHEECSDGHCVANIPPMFGILLSRTWVKKVGGSLQMDLTYATIPVFGGKHRRLYREVRLSYILSDHQNPRNYPIYVVEDDIGSFVFHLNDDEPKILVS